MAYLTGQVLTQADIAALFASGTYTPTLANMAIGTGGTPVNSAKYTFVGFPAGGVLTVEGKIKFGTTSITLPGASVETISLPAGYTMITADAGSELNATLTFFDVSAGIVWKGAVCPSTTTTVQLLVWLTAAPGLNTGSLSATVPFTWAVSDEIHYKFSVRCTGP